MNKKIPALIINGNLGAGKTAVGKILAERLSFRFLSSGNFFREEAVSRGITFDELHKLMIEDSSVDILLDDRLKTFLKENTSYVLDSRMAAFFEPHAFKVFVSVSPRIGAERIYADIQINPLRHSESGASSVDDVLAQNTKRAESEQIRYRELYGFDHLDKSAYDFVCDSSSTSPEDLADKIEEAYKEWIRV